MLRSWPDQIGIALLADRLVIARASSGWRRQLQQKETVMLPPPPEDSPRWQPAIDALAQKIAAGELAGAEVSLVLSSSFMHYALVPWSNALGSEEEELAFARHCFARVHGADAEHWELRLSAKRPDRSRLACAAAPQLIDALERVMAPLGTRYCSLQPYLMASFNRWRARFNGKPCWFVTVEPGLLCVALLGDGQWLSVRTVKVGAAWLAALPTVLKRETCLVESGTACNDVWIFAADGTDPATHDAGQWQFKNLVPSLLPGMDPGADAAYSIALRP
ncbi:MAG: hypothetical protein JWN94_3861 [Betaproteobacteria bacterium]|nr:hypothetical protein [Betaproteobacteria bacterium]